MTQPALDDRGKYVRSMFARISQRYDLLNRIMTLGFDLAWRRDAVQRLELPAKAVVLDLGTGTGDIAFEVLRQSSDALVIASDFTPEMISVGKMRAGGERVCWVIADAQQLPFETGAVDGVISGYLLRNVSNLDRALAEQSRILRARGRFVSLDTTPPTPGPLRPLIEFYLRSIIPALGKLVAGDSEAYTYLPQSTEGFLSVEALAARVRAAGFDAVGFSRRMLGTMAIHWGRKS